MVVLGSKCIDGFGGGNRMVTLERNLRAVERSIKAMPDSDVKNTLLIQFRQKTSFKTPPN